MTSQPITTNPPHPPTYPLPTLTNLPTKHHGSCLHLSLPLIHLLLTLLPQDTKRVVSIGSGLGLLEALLLHHFHSPHPDTPSSYSMDTTSCKKTRDISLTCIEVETHRREKKYVSERVMAYVSGAWMVSAEVADAARADVWLFVYPRDPRLLRGYVDARARCGGAAVRCIIWVGPEGDAPEFCNVIPEGAGFVGEAMGEGVLQSNEKGYVWRCAAPADQEADELDLQDI